MFILLSLDVFVLYLLLEVPSVIMISLKGLDKFSGTISLGPHYFFLFHSLLAQKSQSDHISNQTLQAEMMIVY